jgi:homeobox protein cut-like
VNPGPLHDSPVRHPAAFKKSASPDVTRAVGPLLKAYQEEIDRLTSRAKAGEAAFLDVYQKLYEAPNPAPALSAGLVSDKHA